MSEEYQRLHDAATGNIIKGIRVSRSSAINVRTNTYSVPRHALATLSEKLIQQGRSLLFTTCSLLVQKLLIANRDLRLPKMIRQMSNVEALIIDDLGYVQQSREEMEVLFTLLAERDESGSVLLTSNLAFSNLD